MSETARRSFREVPSPREVEWRRTLDRWTKSGLNVRAFCRREAISEHLFHSWKRKIRLRDLGGAKPVASGPVAVPFIPLEPSGVNDFVAVIEVILSRDRRLRLAAGADPEMVARLVGVLERAAC